MSLFQAQWEAYGYTLRFEWDDPVCEQAIRSIVLPDWVESGGEPNTIFELSVEDGDYSIKQDGVLKGQRLPETSLDHSLKRWCHIDLATYAPDLVFVHSGVVKTPNGLLMLPARTYSGKSTLVKSLVEIGCQYYSDEYAVIDASGHVRPFPRRLCERLKGGEHRYHPALELGWHKDLVPERLSAVVSTRYQSGTTWSPIDLSQGEAVLKMLENTVSARTEPQRAISFLAEAVKGARCVEGPRGESTETATRLLEWMASPS